MFSCLNTGFGFCFEQYSLKKLRNDQMYQIILSIFFQLLFYICIKCMCVYIYITYTCLDRLHVIDLGHVPNWCNIGLVSMNATLYMLGIWLC